MLIKTTMSCGHPLFMHDFDSMADIFKDTL